MKNNVDTETHTIHLYSRPEALAESAKHYERLIGVQASFRHLVDDLNEVIKVDGPRMPILSDILKKTQQAQLAFFGAEHMNLYNLQDDAAEASKTSQTTRAGTTQKRRLFRFWRRNQEY